MDIDNTEIAFYIKFTPAKADEIEQAIFEIEYNLRNGKKKQPGLPSNLILLSDCLCLVRRRVETLGGKKFIIIEVSP